MARVFAYYWVPGRATVSNHERTMKRSAGDNDDQEHPNAFEVVHEGDGQHHANARWDNDLVIIW